MVNKMDRTGADFYRCVDMIVDRVGAVPLVCQLPLGVEENFQGVIDLVKMKAIVWGGEELGAKFEEQEIPAEYAAKAKEYREKLIEIAVEQDDALLADYLDGKEPSLADLKKCIRKGTVKFKFVPIFCGSAFKNKGVQPLLDAVVDYLPTPLDRGILDGIDPDAKDPENNTIQRKPDDKESLSMLAFKIMDDPFVGSITFCRVYSGTVTSGMSLTNSSKDRKERVGRMLLMHANSREDIKEAYAGDIVALAGLKETRTGDTLCDPAKPIILEKMEFPEPVIELAIEPKSKADQEKLGIALSKLASEDP